MSVQSRIEDDILVITLDDGEKNALVPESFQAIIAALDEATPTSGVLLTGRPGIFTAGLNVKWMAANGRAGVQQLLVEFGGCAMRLWTDPRPTVCAAPGHAIAAGTMLAMACDHAVAAEDGYWGLTETQIDFEMPRFGIALARANVRTDRLEDAILPGARLSAAEAVEAGFADELAPEDEVMARATARAAELAALPARAYGGTKERLRQTIADEIVEGLEDDIAALTAHLPD